MLAWFWFRLTAKGKPASHWEGIGRAAGYLVDGPDAQCAYDAPIENSRQVLPKEMPELQRLVLAMKAGDRLGVPLVGLFGSPRVWAWLMTALVRKKCVVHDVATGRVFDPANGVDIADGLDLLVQQRGHLRVEPAQEGKAAGGKKGGRKLALTGKRLLEVRLLFVTDERSVPDIAEEYDVSVPTIYRAMTDTGQKGGKRVNRAAAKLMHAEGRWIPVARHRKTIT